MLVINKPLFVVKVDALIYVLFLLISLIDYLYILLTLSNSISM